MKEFSLVFTPTSQPSVSLQELGSPDGFLLAKV